MRDSSLTRRVVLFVLLPLAVVFAASLVWMERALRQNTAAEVRAGLEHRELLRQREQARQSRELQRALQVLSENAGLKAALVLQRDIENSGALRDPTTRAELQRTLDERLDAIREATDADLLAMVNAHEATIATWQRRPGGVYRRQEIPINLEQENLGRLVFGRELDLASLAGGAEAVLIENGRVERATLPVARFAGVVRDWTQTGEFVLAGERWLAVPMVSTELDPGRRIVMLASVDTAVAPFVRTLRLVLVPAGAISLGFVLTLVWFTSRAVTTPLQRLTDACQESIQKGILEIPPTQPAGVHEIDVLADSLHRAAVAASDARRSLQQAYLEILEALVESLEARDQYTAGHSRRVSLYSVWIGQQMGLSPAELERLRIGALLHDIGKIGIPDAVLLKDGRLTDEEFATIKKHPEIGVRILERIGAFGEYLGAVGLHHENHDGSGYPKGLRGEAIPVDARIVHVADAYDAMTSNRPYRQRMPEEKVRRILKECSGTQFDPAAVAAFFASPIDSTAANLEKLHEAIHDPAVRVPLADSTQPLAG
jgi:HD-GYP domain-containing protein (c-di-GMP phosphodiesterase class II)